MTAPNNRERILPRLIDDEIKESFINYSMSVIVSRALPDVRDGLKPVHRRVLYSMFDTGLVPGRPYKKCATVVGDVLGKYHPHGDSSVYDALVRMVQEFSLRYPLIDGQGNFGSVDGDPRGGVPLHRIAVDADRDGDVGGHRQEHRQLRPELRRSRSRSRRFCPAGIPNLVVNGSSGIAVGMATNIPPHNLREVVNAIIHLVDNPDATIGEHPKVHQGSRLPDRRLHLRPRRHQGLSGDGTRAHRHARARGDRGEGILEQVADRRHRNPVSGQQREARSRTSPTWCATRSSKASPTCATSPTSDGMRIVIELKRDAIPRVVLNQLYKHTAMQSTFGVIMLALVPDAHTGSLVPKVMPLKEVLEHYIAHRHEVIVRRTQFDLDKALEREHILEGLKIAVDNIDEVIKVIRKAADTPTASAQLQKRFKLSERQAEAILNMRLAKLTGLEIEKLEEELKEVRALIKELPRAARVEGQADEGAQGRAASRSPRSTATSAARRSRATRASSRSRI